MPKVSVIIPVYGVEKYIGRCARSLFEQTLDDIEYLFVDDCTPDRSIEILEQVLDEYPTRKAQVTIHCMEHNSGQAKVREWGMRNATGEYVIHCDSDDWVDTDMYRVMYEKAVQNCADMVICGYDEITADEIAHSHVNRELKKDQLFRSILTGHASASLWNKLVKQESFKSKIKYPSGNMGEDMFICLQQVLFSESISYVKPCFYKYRVNDFSITRSISKKGITQRFWESKKNAQPLIQILKDKGLYNMYKKEVDVLLFNKKNALIPLIKEDYYYRLWRNSYEDINRRILVNPIVPIRQKISFVLRLLRII